MTDEAAPAPDWSAIREAYEDRKLKVTEIAAKFAVAPATIYRRIDDEDWERRHAGGLRAKRRAMVRRYADPEAAINTLRTDRAEVYEFAWFSGF